MCAVTLNWLKENTTQKLSKCLVTYFTDIFSNTDEDLLYIGNFLLFQR